MIKVTKTDEAAAESNGSATALISLRKVWKWYETPSGRITALREVDLDVESGECVAVVGKSGSGKTTLINVLTGIDRPGGGTVRVAGAEIHGMSEEELAVWRGRQVGIVFQFFQLLPVLTVMENVMLPMDFAGLWTVGERRRRAAALLERLGIGDQSGKLPADLSGGQQQRAAIARALANDPPLIVADEPTGNLDSRTASDVIGLFAEVSIPRQSRGL